MQYQEKIRFLQRYRTNELEIERLDEEIMRWSSKACKITPSYAGMPNVGGTSDKIQDAVEAISILQEELAQLVVDGIELRHKIESCIDAIQDPRHRQLLRYRYIDCKKWEQIAVLMNYNYRWVLRMHKIAIKNLAIESHMKNLL